MKAVILAAGVGSRLGHPYPKALNKLQDGETILGRQIRLLQECEIREIIIVIGFKMNLIMESFPDVYYKYNPIYYITNTSQSLLSGIKSLNEEVVWLNGDVIFEKEVLERVIKNKGNTVAVNKAVCGDEEVKYKTDNNNFLVEISKKVQNAEGEAIGINKISSDSIQFFKDALKSCKQNDYFEKAIEVMIQNEYNFSIVDTSDLKCIEVDFEEDWQKALSLFC
jgi:choline kinase